MNEKSAQKMIFRTNSGPASTSTLKALMARADLHMQAEQVVLAAIPAELAAGTRFVSCQEGELVLSTDNASKATRLRFRQHEILEALRDNELFRFVWKVKIKVSPLRFRERKPAQKLPLSKENARLLKEEAGHTKDKALREVLEKLASHVRD
ncbi:MAG TPA: DciA family protein [Marinobacter sp.]|nr:DciA family protein [Marinobacter sp.]